MTSTLNFKKNPKKEYKLIKEDIKIIAMNQSNNLESKLNPFGEAMRICKTFKLDEICYRSTVSIKYSPNLFPAVGVLLDSYPSELASFMLAYHFPPNVRGCVMMFLEDIENIEKMRVQLLGKEKKSRIDKAARLIATMLCLMDSIRSARNTYSGITDPNLKERVKTILIEAYPEIAESLVE